MDSYYDYEREFSQLSAEATRSIGQLANVRGEQKKRAIRDVEKLVERLEYTFGDMENAARNSGQVSLQTNITESRALVLAFLLFSAHHPFHLLSI
tara:strand:- start:992 stop:1276 length:285 start_codon:yes stop_codon:yes gene_type:complete